MTRSDLIRYRYAQEWIRGRFEYLETLRTQIEKITTTLSDMPKGSRKVQDIKAEGIAKLIDSTNNVMQVVIEEDEKQKEILNQLSKLEEPYRVILDMKYILGKSLVDIASELGYSYVHICREHGIALNKFDEMI